jgi:hypothetical protein
MLRVVVAVGIVLEKVTPHCYDDPEEGTVLNDDEMLPHTNSRTSTTRCVQIIESLIFIVFFFGRVGVIQLL